ncbi:MAG TPA: neutral zinc metallopeptidase [Burkholderiaceae bacterium]|jgi:predicted metalloprotease|nr:neutral zinc metallopeptidase [Burkholderiaceae bacterium]HRA78302.1 neutral zinc metallopeptidase [Burkholderiaceae bacterium]
MRWQGHKESSNVEDRRAGGLGGRRAGMGIGTIAVAVVAAWLFGVDPRMILGVLEGVDTMTGTSTGQQGPAPAPTDEAGRFVSVVLASTEESWQQVFAQAGQAYRPPKLVLYRGRVGTACGLGAAASGPFYCPGDEAVYIDLEFFQLMSRRLGAPGDFAQAYVIAHEVGHHVQNLLGTMEKMQSLRQRVSEQQYNALSVRLELQADCYAGVWANHSQQARNWLEHGDLEEGMAAASAVGDDRMQMQSQGVVVPDAFTHGSSAQRVRWFRAGLESGRPSQCDTFAAKTL